MPRTPRPYQLTAALAASSVGAGVLCLSAEGLGRTYRLHAQRPGPASNRRIEPRADLPSGAAHVVAPVASSLIRVDIVGPLEQRAGYHDPCAGWTDGHDAVAERLVAAFEQGDVLLVVDSPGGAAAGLQQGVERARKAKAKHGRRVTVWANETIGSAAMWWACGIGDELFIPAMGQVGSIGARGQHTSVAGALAKDGVEVTYFADPPDKIAFAPELPLSPAASARGNRDVKLCADAFRAAVVGSAIGVRHGLTAEALVELGADMLTGQAAVDAGLADGVASEDEVIAYALKMAERAGTKDAGAQARRGGTMPRTAGMTASTAKTRVEEEDAPSAKDAGEDMQRAEGDMPPPSSKPLPGGCECAECGAKHAVSAKYCADCGAPMGDEPPVESSDEEPALVPPAPPAPGASVAEVLGLPADASLPAQKARALELRQVVDHAARLTGQKSPGAIVGALTAMSNDAAQSGRLRRERNDLRQQQANAERWTLARRLAALGIHGHERGLVFVDAVNDDGSRKIDAKTGKPVVTLGQVYAEMRLDTLRGLVEGHERNAPRRDPFEPDPARAEAASRGAQSGGDKAARVERAKKHPRVVAMFNRPGQTTSLEQLASAFVDADFDLQPLGA